MHLHFEARPSFLKCAFSTIPRGAVDHAKSRRAPERLVSSLRSMLSTNRTGRAPRSRGRSDPGSNLGSQSPWGRLTIPLNPFMTRGFRSLGLRVVQSHRCSNGWPRYDFQGFKGTRTGDRNRIGASRGFACGEVWFFVSKCSDHFG